MRPGSLGETDDENDFEYSSRVVNPYELPSTSRATRSKSTAAKTPTKAKNTEKAVKGAARRKMTSRQRQLKTLREIKKFQSTTNLLIPRAPFGRVVREISLDINPDISRYTATALQALQEATEMFLTQILQDSYLLTMHRKCVTLSKADIILIRSLKLNI